MNNFTKILVILSAAVVASCDKPQPEPSKPEVERIELKLPFVADTTSVEIEGINSYQIGEVPEWIEIEQVKEGIELITKRKENIEQASAKVTLSSEEKLIELDITKGGYPTFEADYDLTLINSVCEIQLSNVQNIYDIIVISSELIDIMYLREYADDELYDAVTAYQEAGDYYDVKHYWDFQNGKTEIYFPTFHTAVLIFAVDENHYSGKRIELTFDV